MLDVAKLAGVAAGTVSNVLNRPGKVAESTRSRVQAAIDELGFVRNSSARVLAAGVSDLVGFVLVDLDNSFFVDIARGAEAALGSAGLRLLLANSDVEAGKQESYLRLFEETRTAGILLAPLDGPLDVARGVQSRGRPTVLVNAPGPEEDWCNVVVDEELGGFLAADHLLGQGARRLGFVGGPLHLRAVEARLRGVRRAVADHGASLTLRQTTRLHGVEGREAGAGLLREDPGLDGIVCASDLLAIGVVAAVRSAGRRVPDDMLVIGYDDNHMAFDGEVPISSVRQPGRAMGQRAAELLTDEIRLGPAHVHQRIVVEPELVVRTSSRRRPDES